MEEEIWGEQDLGKADNDEGIGRDPLDQIG